MPNSTIISIQTLNMKHTVFWLLCSLLLVMACKDEPAAPELKVGASSIRFGADESSSRTVSISCNTEWTAFSSADWLNVSPEQGTPRNTTLTLTPLSGNFTKAVRKATVIVRTATLEHTLTVVQDISSEGDNVWGVKDEYRIAAEGGYIDMSVTTTVPPGMLHVQGDKEDSWITMEIPASAPQSRWESGASLRFKVEPNEDRLTRMSTLSFVKSSPWGGNFTTLKTVSIVQEGKPDTSTDFSSDGKVLHLQTATKGTGLPIVLAGDGFIDKDVADGTYEQTMKETMEVLFDVEPMQTLRDYFDVYAVVAVSKHNDFGGNNSTAFGCRYKNKLSSLITGSDKAGQNYVRKTKADMDKALLIVVLNATQYGGTTTFGYLNSNAQYIDFAISYCPLMRGTDSPLFRKVLVHEAVGHGLAKLGDEYAYEEQGSIPATEIRKLESLQEEGWMQNISMSDIPQQTPWGKFTVDTRYASEQLGAYQGAYTYWSGVYRPTPNSIMNQNGSSFNVPSREAIYKRVMKESSPQWTYDYEKFVEFDASLPARTSRATDALSLPHSLVPPVVTNKLIGQD